MAKPVQNTKRLAIYVTPELEKFLQEESIKKGINVSSLVRMILMEYKEEKDK